MADQIDLAQHYEDMMRANAIRAARQPVPAGVPGECGDCGDDSPRLVGGRCAPCREPNPRLPRRF
ncbi:conjugal transfer protein TraR [Sphingomonas sp. R-74633]|uniref:conjugal transfer protein TraR n=1 Tax=Sphingomonas sp. R-74633 TaxID=2751188 RepID=UPI0015D43D01|nr:conjugal transfer protein TraR [Sphingomonas sp. R-74633]NYT43125.1 conjugal transfer protein TraR [Sphingomonas sp. R-74633]